MGPDGRPTAGRRRPRLGRRGVPWSTSGRSRDARPGVRHLRCLRPAAGHRPRRPGPAHAHLDRRHRATHPGTTGPDRHRAGAGDRPGPADGDARPRAGCVRSGGDRAPSPRMARAIAAVLDRSAPGRLVGRRPRPPGRRRRPARDRPRDPAAHQGGGDLRHQALDAAGLPPGRRRAPRRHDGAQPHGPGGRHSQPRPARRAGPRLGRPGGRTAARRRHVDGRPPDRRWRSTRGTGSTGSSREFTIGRTLDTGAP